MKKFGVVVLCVIAAGVVIGLNVWKVFRSGASMAMPVWSYNYSDKEGTTVLDTTGVKIVFQGKTEQSNGTYSVASGILAVSGPLSITDSGPLKQQYADGVCSLSLYGHSLQLSNAGRVLFLDGQSFELGRRKKILTVESNGLAHLTPAP